MGTRMKSQQAKVLHEVLGRPMLAWVLQAAKDAGCSRANLITSLDVYAQRQALGAVQDFVSHYIHQLDKRGTADAVASAAAVYANAETPHYLRSELLAGTPKADLPEGFLILAGDTPALDAKLLADFLAFCHQEKADLAVLGLRLEEPKGYGRLIVSKKGDLEAILEEKDADEVTRKISLCNSGVLFVKAPLLFRLLCQVDNRNRAGEYYLTDIIGIAHAQGLRARVFETLHHQAFQGVNDRWQLLQAEEFLRRKQQRRLAEGGVRLYGPESIYLDDEVYVDQDVSLFPGVVLRGKTRVGLGSVIGPHAVLIDCEVGSQAQVGAHCFLQNVHVADGEIIHPLTTRS
jgi:bifunctional UDP-N-acetylglucosamine pyrophosphorylase/glucosamine-1-phosphate N-acetyltransferase